MIFPLWQRGKSFLFTVLFIDLFSHVCEKLAQQKLAISKQENKNFAN
jgi:hypothetical protein